MQTDGTKSVALTLASGGARGMAHIGAIEELIARGYEIHSISGCSIGSLIGGIFAAGKIAEARDWFCALDRQTILQLSDFSFGLSHMVKGNRVMDAIREWVPDRLIEDLPIEASFVATDLLNSSEVIFRSGPLFEAIRASISIPLCFEPVHYEDTLLVDGGLTNPFPLNRVARAEGDILVGVNISGTSVMPDPYYHIGEISENWENRLEKLGRIGDKAEQLWNHMAQQMDSTIAPSFNYLSLINRTVDVQIQANCRLMMEMCKPDVYVEMAQDAYTTFDFDKAAEIMDRGRELMAAQLDEYENRLKNDGEL